jgi:hypothetical protein
VDQELLTFNGVDGTTGRYRYPPTSLEELVARVRGEAFGTDIVDELIYRRREPAFGVVFGVDAENLPEAGWGLIAAVDTPEPVLEALAPLRRMRSGQAGQRYRECIGQDGYRPGEDKRGFLARWQVASALPANPDKMPYYLLLVGGPELIPFSFQYQLDVQYAVGRVAFDTPEEYARYADAVVAAEADHVRPTMRLFGPSNAHDRATQSSSASLVGPLSLSLGEKEPHWDVTALAPRDCDTAALGELLAGDEAHLLFSATHGVALERGDERQREAQGALVGQNWPGPVLARGLAESMYFSGADAAQLPAVGTRIMMSFACFGAGTPLGDDFDHLRNGEGRQLTDVPFVARLPQRLLGHPSGHMLAFVGHVERAWGCSFTQAGVGPQQEVFLSALRSLMCGWRVGHAMEYFNDKYAALTAELHEILDGVRRSGDRPDGRRLTGLWLENNDARSYAVLGDPAVRLGRGATGPGDADGSYRVQQPLP